MNQIKFTFGDYSGDGHGLTETVIFKTELDEKELSKYIDLIQATLGIKLDNEVFDEKDLKGICQDYEDFTLPTYFVNILKERNFDFSTLDVYEWYKDEIEKGIVKPYLNDFAKIIIFCLKETYREINGTELKIEIDKSIPEIVEYWGYGLFSCQ